MTSASRPEHPEASEAPSVAAAGGVVLLTGSDSMHVLVVHRPAYDDWTLPKGHVDADETPAAAAVREVREETGVLAHITGEAGGTTHPVTRTQDGATRTVMKHVQWYWMQPETGSADPSQRAADPEVDRAAWWPIDQARDALTYASERELLGSVPEDRR